jgi:hypothetical protein
MVRDMRGMRGKSESRERLSGIICPRSRSGGPRFMHHLCTWPANDLQQHKVIGGHTYIYADSGQFCSRRTAFFYYDFPGGYPCLPMDTPFISRKLSRTLLSPCGHALHATEDLRQVHSVMELCAGRARGSDCDCFTMPFKPGQIRRLAGAGEPL